MALIFLTSVDSSNVLRTKHVKISINSCCQHIAKLKKKNDSIGVYIEMAKAINISQNEWENLSKVVGQFFYFLHFTAADAW